MPRRPIRRTRGGWREWRENGSERERTEEGRSARWLVLVRKKKKKEKKMPRPSARGVDSRRVTLTLSFSLSFSQSLSLARVGVPRLDGKEKTRFREHGAGAREKKTSGSLAAPSISLAVDEDDDEEEEEEDEEERPPPRGTWTERRRRWTRRRRRKKRRRTVPASKNPREFGARKRGSFSPFFSLSLSFSRTVLSLFPLAHSVFLSLFLPIVLPVQCAVCPNSSVYLPSVFFFYFCKVVPQHEEEGIATGAEARTHVGTWPHPAPASL
ncbi:hypothetical protein PUN28_008675 [Cardiocondyla obscurior]|uniref:Uncharacterized protein n=1 Tax=Cardiocondyla obscurior TaxID=286306 RepID=A0AAW2FYU9_9HYME